MRLPRLLAPLLLVATLASGCGWMPNVEGTSTSAPTLSAGTPDPGLPGFAKIAAGLRTGVDTRVAIVGDSTSATEINWPRLWARAEAVAFPDAQVRVRDWDWDNDAYGADIVLDKTAKHGGITIVNASKPGGDLSYQLKYLDRMFGAGERMDVVIINMGHNYKLVSPEAYLKAMDGFIAEFAKRQPDAAVIITSQNPQFEPAKAPEPHNARQRALQAWATQHGYEYVDTFEQFLAQPKQGRDLVQSDGVHPTTIGDASGAAFWASQFTKRVAAA